MQNEILRPVLETDETAIPRYDIVNPDGSVSQQNVELRLKNEVMQQGTPYDEESVLPATLLNELGLPTSATPAQAFQAILTKFRNVFTKSETLSDTTKSLFGLGSNAVPNDALAMLSRFQKGLGNEYIWEKSKTKELEDVVELTNVEIWRGANGNNNTFYVGTGFTNNSGNDVYPYKLTGTTSFSAYSQTADSVKNNFLGKYISAYDVQSMSSTKEKGVYYIPSNAIITFTTESYQGILYYKFIVNKVTVTRNHRFVTTKYGYVNSPNSNAYPPSVSDGYDYTLLGQMGEKVRIETGSYTGTGSTTKTLTFSFNPEFVFIYKIDSNSYGVNPATNGWKEHGIIFCRYQDNYWFDGNVYPKLSFNDNTLEMSGASAANQVYNISSQNYRYIAVG